jgi:tetratricopeptide (TPR) repeat protein
MVTFARIGFGILLGSAVGGLSWASAKCQERGQVHGGGESAPTQAQAERFQKLVAQCTDLQERAARAEAAGDLTGSEHWWLEANRLIPHLVEYPLAKLHEKMGKYKEALPEYKYMIGHGEAQFQILARCGDLDMIYGSKEDAREEYMRAAEAPSDYSDKTFAPVAAGEPVGKTASLTQLRAAAYYDAGKYFSSAGPYDVGRKYLELALSLEPDDALMRFGYSCVAPDPQAEKWLAEKEATGVLKEALHRMRVEHAETLGTSYTAIIHGKAFTTVTEYLPKGVTKTNPNGNIFTPHVVDPVMQGRAGWIWEGAAEANRP